MRKLLGGIKVISQWFPIRERALAGGIFNSGTVPGLFLAPLLIVPLGSHFGWRMTFIIPSALGPVVDYALARLLPRPYKSTRPIRGATADLVAAPAANPARLGRHPDSRAGAAPVVHFYWYWLPEYLRRERGFSMEEIGWTAGIPFLFAGLGNLAGGWFSGHLIARGWPTDRARKAALPDKRRPLRVQHGGSYRAQRRHRHGLDLPRDLRHRHQRPDAYRKLSATCSLLECWPAWPD